MSNADHNETTPPDRAARLPDPYGEAALVLVESLIHGILSRGGLSLDETIEIAQTAIDAQIEVCIDRDEEPATAPSIRFLEALAASLRIDQDKPGQTTTVGRAAMIRGGLD